MCYNQIQFSNTPKISLFEKINLSFEVEYNKWNIGKVLRTMEWDKSEKRDWEERDMLQKDFGICERQCFSKKKI